MRYYLVHSPNYTDPSSPDVDCYTSREYAEAKARICGG